MDLSDLIERNARFAPEKPALIFEGEVLSYAAFHARIVMLPDAEVEGADLAEAVLIVGGKVRGACAGSGGRGAGGSGGSGGRGAGGPGGSGGRGAGGSGGSEGLGPVGRIDLGGPAVPGGIDRTSSARTDSSSARWARA